MGGKNTTNSEESKVRKFSEDDGANGKSARTFDRLYDTHLHFGDPVGTSMSVSHFFFGTSDSLEYSAVPSLCGRAWPRLESAYGPDGAQSASGKFLEREHDFINAIKENLGWEECF